MQSDIVNLRSFYKTALGRVAERSIAMAMASQWKPIVNERLLGLGYTVPWLNRFSVDAERALAFMPARQGATHWPKSKPSATALVFDEELPLPASSIDRAILVHALEHSEAPRETLMELWRVLAPNGRLIVVVPHRQGIWARMEHTPFASGRPFSRGQITKLLREANFTPESVGEALLFPPFQREYLMRFAPTVERLGRGNWPFFAGALVIEAKKQLYQGLPVAERSSRRVFVPVLSPQGASRNARGQIIAPRKL